MEGQIIPSNKLMMEQIQENVRKLVKWFHKINLNGVQTAPDHFFEAIQL